MGTIRDTLSRLLGSTSLPPVVTVSSASHARVPSITRQGSAVDRVRPTAFDIGRTGRRLAAIPGYTTGLNSLIQFYGAKAVARSRQLAINNPYAKAAKEAWVSAMAGPGIKPSTLGETAEVKQAIQELWLDWCAEADYDGNSDFYGLQDVIAGEVFEAGEAFVVLEENTEESTTVPLKLRVIPAEMCPYYGSLPGTFPGNTTFMGVEFNEAGKRVAYHFLRRPPGEFRDHNTFGTVTERIPANRVLHIFKTLRPGQVRGIPVTLAGMATLAMLDLYDDAELERKRTAALFAAFVTKSDGAEDGDSPLGSLITTDPSKPANSYPLEPGAVVGMEVGEDIKFSAPADVGANYEGFEYRNLLKAACGFGVPYSSFTGDLKAVNYSSIRAGLVEFRRKAEAMQHNVFIFKLCRPVWIRFLDLATFAGTAPWSASEYMANIRLHRRVKWLTPKWDWVDPYKDLQAEKLAVDNGFKSRSDVIEAEGYDPEETDARIISDMKREESFPRPLNNGQVIDTPVEDEPEPPARNPAPKAP